MSSASGGEKRGKYNGEVEFGQITKDGCKVVLQLLVIKLLFWFLVVLFGWFLLVFFVGLFLLLLVRGTGAVGFLLVKSRGQTNKRFLR